MNKETKEDRAESRDGRGNRAGWGEGKGGNQAIFQETHAELILPDHHLWLTGSVQLWVCDWGQLL